MIQKSAAALASLLALLSCSLGPPRLDPLTAEDQALFACFTCRAIRDGAVIYIGTGNTGVIRYRGRRVQLTRLQRDTPFKPVETLENLTMTSSEANLELSFLRMWRRRGRTATIRAHPSPGASWSRSRTGHSALAA